MQNIRRYITLIPILWMGYTMIAQDMHTLLGIVKDEAGETLIGANVFLPELEKGTVTGVDGDFIITGLPAGRFILQVSFVGYETSAFSIWIGRDQQPLKIHLHTTTIKGGGVEPINGLIFHQIEEDGRSHAVTAAPVFVSAGCDCRRP